MCVVCVFRLASSYLSSPELLKTFMRIASSSLHDASDASKKFVGIESNTVQSERLCRCGHLQDIRCGPCAIDIRVSERSHAGISGAAQRPVHSLSAIGV